VLLKKDTQGSTIVLSQYIASLIQSRFLQLPSPTFASSVNLSFHPESDFAFPDPFQFLPLVLSQLPFPPHFSFSLHGPDFVEQAENVLGRRCGLQEGPKT
jgi:hypothetical protein